MIPEGTLISVELPGREGEEVLARVLKCSAKGQSCRLELLDSGDEAGVRVSVNIAKCRYEIVDEEALAAAAGSEDDSEDGAEAMDVFSDLGVDAAPLEALASADPASLTSRSAEVAAAARAAAAVLIDYAGRQAAPSAVTAATDAPPPALHVEGFDAEQIWLQLDALSVPALKRARKQLKKAEDIDTLMSADVEEALNELLGVDGGGESGSEEEDDEEGGSEGEEGSKEEDGSLDYEAMLEAGRGAAWGDDESSEEEEDAEDEEEEEEEEEEERGKRRRRMGDAEARAAVEDEFMKLDEMEAFLAQAEAAAAGEDEERDDDESDSDVDDAALGRGGGSSEDEGDDSEAELEAVLDAAAGLVGRKRKKDKKKRKFSGYSDSEEEEEGRSNDDDAAVDLADDPMANARYEDFFGPRKGGAKPAANGRGAAAKAPARRGRDVLAEDPSTSEDDFEDGYGDEEDDGGAGGSSGEEEGGEDGSSSDGEDGARPSAHQRRLDRVAARIAKLEEQAMGEKDWWMAGEVVGGARPKNSALEIDLDFETTVKPPPPPTEEGTKSLEQLIIARIAEGRFDDPIKMAPPPPEKARVAVELDDKKSALGLGELYERDYVAAVTGTVEDKDAAVRETALAQFKALSAALDALSHGHFRPVPSIEEVTVKVDVPAIMMEEAAPAFVSAASMRAPEEVYRAGTGVISGSGAAKEGEEEGKEDGLAVVPLAGGAFKSEAELTKEERRRRRAGKKRAGKKRKAATEEDKAARAAAKGETYVPGRKSEEEARELERAAKAARKSGAGGISNFSRSAKVFGALQAAREGGGAAAAAAAVGADRPAVRASGLKL